MNKIRSNKEQLKRAEDAFQRRDTLWNDRLRVEAELTEATARRVGTPLEEDDHIKKLKLKKIEIDHLLDEIDGEDEQRIAQLRESLITSILEHFPDQVTVYESLTRQCSRGHLLETKLEALIESSEKIAHSIHIALRAWERPITTRILRFIFGQSPTEEITENLQRAGERCEAALEHLEGYAAHDPSDLRASELCEQMQQFCHAFIAEREERWSFTSLKKTYRPSFQAVERFIERFEVQRELAHEAKRAADREMQEWVERHTFEED